MRLLLDTCTYLWMVADGRRLPADVRALIVDPGNSVLLSAVSTWEIAVKHQLGKLELPYDPERSVPDIRRQHAVETLPLDEESTLHLRKLPRLHADPFDRMLICQAIVHGLPLVTPDRQIAQYPIRTIW